MAKADRLARLDERRIEAEADYHCALLTALRSTAAGQLRVFGHAKDKAQIARAAPMVAELGELGDDIDHLREQLSLEPFALHAEFLASRGPASAHAVGEPKQAQAWLARLEATETST